MITRVIRTKQTNYNTTHRNKNKHSQQKQTKINTNISFNEFKSTTRYISRRCKNYQLKLKSSQTNLCLLRHVNCCRDQLKRCLFYTKRLFVDACMREIDTKAIKTTSETTSNETNANDVKTNEIETSETKSNEIENEKATTIKRIFEQNKTKTIEKNELFKTMTFLKNSNVTIALRNDVVTKSNEFLRILFATY